MAAIDFPASPTTGQTFAASNGITYMWTGTIWVATAPSGTSPGGDFCAVGVANAPAAETVQMLPVITGNSGGWYNAANGRFTPPAGRYCLFAAAGFSNSTTGGVGVARLRKNGVIVATQNSNWYTANAVTEAMVSILADANGVDYFEFVTAGNIGTNTASNMQFSAFPVSGIKGPPGDPGQLGFRLLQRTAVSSAVADVKIQNIPADINDLMFAFDLQPVTNAMDLVMQFYNAAGTLMSTAGTYASATTVATHTQTTGSAPSVSGSATVGVTNSILMNYSNATRRILNSTGIQGRGTVPNIRGAGVKGVEYQSNYISDDGIMLMAVTGNGYHSTAGAISGLRLVFGGGNIASGAFSVWGSP